MRVMVTASRHCPDDGYIASVLDRFHEIECPITLVIEGECPTPVGDRALGFKSGDLQARDWALGSGIPVMGMPAAWDFYKKEAGGLRNGWMLRYGSPDLLLAFPMPDSRGTWNAVRQATDLGVRTVIDKVWVP
ncbi:MAG TPA: hypothetical protein VN756_12820 [Solirubrobacterales bacterium]|nr:hypothetical protein [Actinoplanes sp.]HXS48331.1 hypothetical protein [Solirubrobacterales bacterium]